MHMAQKSKHCKHVYIENFHSHPPKLVPVRWADHARTPRVAQTALLYALRAGERSVARAFILTSVSV